MRDVFRSIADTVVCLCTVWKRNTFPLSAFTLRSWERDLFGNVFGKTLTFIARLRKQMLCKINNEWKWQDEFEYGFRVSNIVNGFCYNDNSVVALIALWFPQYSNTGVQFCCNS